MLRPIDNAGSFGMQLDDSPYVMEAAAWNKAHNVRGESDGMTLTGTWRVSSTLPPTKPLDAVPLILANSAATIVAGDTGVHVVDPAGVWNNITRASGVYAATEEIGWSICNFNSIPVLTNGVDVPQAQMPPSLTQKLIDMPAWPATHRARLIIGFKNYLVAFDITKSGTRFSNLVLWSHPCDPGALPVSWDVADPTKEAGEFPLGETATPITAVALMRDQLIIYKEDQVWAMQWVGGVNVFRFVKLFNDIGALGRKAVVGFDVSNARHLVVGANGVSTHDGVRAEPLLSPRARNKLISGFHKTQKWRTFCITNKNYNEVWICYGLGDLQDQALVWNWVTGAVTTKDIPPSTFMVNLKDFTAPPSRTYDEWSEQWATSLGIWDEDATKGFYPILAAAYSDKLIYSVDAGAFQGTKIATSTLERRCVQLGPQRRDGSYALDVDNEKLVLAIRPKLEAAVGFQLLIGVAGTDTASAEPVYEFQNYTHGVDFHADFLVAGRFIHVIFQIPSTFLAFRLDGYAVDWQFTGGSV